MTIHCMLDACIWVFFASTWFDFIIYKSPEAVVMLLYFSVGSSTITKYSSCILCSGQNWNKNVALIYLWNIINIYMTETLIHLCHSRFWRNANRKIYYVLCIIYFSGYSNKSRFIHFNFYSCCLHWVEKKSSKNYVQPAALNRTAKAVYNNLFHRSRGRHHVCNKYKRGVHGGNLSEAMCVCVYFGKKAEVIN